jgi:PKD repeat protein
MKKIFVIIFLLLCNTLLFAQFDQLKVMYYNILDYPDSDPGREVYFRTINQYLQADVILVCELKTNTGASLILNDALNVYGTTKYAKATFNQQLFSENLLYYNSDKLALYSQDVIYTDLRDINEYILYYKSSDLATSNDTIFFYFYVAHLKASEGYEAERLAEVNDFLSYINAIPNAENVFFGGDFNLYTSSEPAYQAVINNSIYSFNDPLPAGNWHNSSTYSDIHTQSTRTADFGGGSTGGMDDRFDFILFTDDVLNNTNRVQYIINSCEAFGNDGNHFNDALIDFPLNPSLPDSVTYALYYMSDHLPIICDLQVEATIDTTQADLVITEIMYNSPEAGTDSLEFIEIYNNGGVVIDLGGYYFSSGVDYTFPSVSINPGDYIVSAVNSQAMMNTFGVSAFEWTSGGLSNGGELIELRNSSGLLIDEVLYGDSSPWPTSPDGQGSSLILCDPDSDNNMGSNWEASQNFITNNGNGDPIYASPGGTECEFPPVAAFTANQTIINPGDFVNFSDLSTGNPTSWSWIFEGGSPAAASIQNPSVQYNTSGVYNVSLEVTNSAGTSTLELTDYINVLNDEPVLIITEIMQNPAIVNDSEGEWFEVFNPTQSPIDMINWYVKDNDFDSIKILSSVIVPANGFAVLGINSNSSLNGGYTCDYEYSNFFLSNSGDEIILFSPEETEIDRVEYDGGPDFPDPSGSSMVYTGIVSDDNALSSFWIEATAIESTYTGSTTNKGSPGTNGVDQNLQNPYSGFDLTIKVYLEGAFNGIEMNTVLNQFSEFPLGQPYNQPPWNYTGNESIVAIPNSDIVDWILLELRDAASSATATASTIIEQRAAFILKDGSVVEMDGISTFHFDNEIVDNLFISIIHRNHLSILSNDAIVINSGSATYDFTESGNAAYLNGQKEIEPGKWVMYSGDIDGNGTVEEIPDKISWEVSSGKKEYNGSDLNLDSEVNNIDKDDFWLPNIGNSSQLPD